MAEKEYIEREAAMAAACKALCHPGVLCPDFKCAEVRNAFNAIPAADVRPVPEGGIGEMSDGYHTFNGLYYQRMVLFAALVRAHKDKAWKSRKHEDGKPCFDGGWFIVGIDTPQGNYTYHYEDKYWNWFECEELPVAKHWDGHTEEDVTRLLSLDVRPVVVCANCEHNNHCLTQEFVDDCGKIPLDRNTFFCADGLLSKICRTESRRPDCPLVPVPAHGRLIDADALKPYMLNEHYKYRLVYDAVEVANAPTIIPAEEGE